MKKTTLFIVEDHSIVIEGIISFLIGNNDFELIGSASSANQLFDFLTNNQPDILILDIKLDGLQGFQIAKIVSNKYPGIKIIFLSSNTDQASLNEAIETGGLGYLSKDVNEEEFILALNKIKNGENYYSKGIQKAVFDSFTNNIKTNNHNNSVPLSTRETEVIKLFVDGLSYKEIANRLSISSRTVETHKKHILEKLELKTTVDLVKYAILNGLTDL